MIFADDKLKLIDKMILDFYQFQAEQTSESFEALVGCISTVIGYKPEEDDDSENQN